MKKFTAPLRWLWLCAALAITGCFHDDNDNTNSTVTTTVSGTAATGAAMTGTVTAVGANSAQANTTLGAGGAYTLNVNGLTFPLLIKANDGAGTVLYSWADAAGDTANITPLTTLALVFSDLSDNLNEVFANWAASSAQLTAATMQAAQAKVNANLQTQFAAKGVDQTTYDFLTTAFTANGSGIDGVLDALDFSFNYLGSNLAGVVTINLAGTTTPVTINIDINTSGIIIGGNPGGSTACSSGWCLTVTGTITTSGIVANIPATTVSGLPADAVPTASNGGNVQQSIQDAYGATGTISNLNWTIVSSNATETVAHLTFDVAVTSPVAMNASYDLTYTYTKAGGSTGGTGGGSTSPLVISSATPVTLNGTLNKATALFEAGSSNAAMTTFNATDDHCRVGAYVLSHSGNGQTYFIEISFRKDSKAVGLLKFGTDAGLVALTSVSGPLTSVVVDIANRRLGFTNVTLSTLGTSVTLNGSLEYPTNVAAENRAACG